MSIIFKDKIAQIANDSIESSFLSSNNNNNNNTTFIHVIDESGSMGCNVKPGITRLDKEEEILKKEILKNPESRHLIITYHDTAKNCGYIQKHHINKEEQLVRIPQLSPKNSTYTANAFKLILDELPKINTNNIIINTYTDGNTDSSPKDFDKSINIFDSKNIPINIFAISSDNTNLETISKNEERGIPGMDLINMLKNSINSFVIYNRFHYDEPFVGGKNSKINRNQIVFMDIPINKHLIDFLHDLLDMLEQEYVNIDWGNDFKIFKEMISEIGKLLTLLFINLDSNHQLIVKISDTISKLNDSFNSTRIFNIINYGFICTKENVPIVYTNFDGHVIDASVKHSGFDDAETTLKRLGTTLNAEKCISIPYRNHKICIIHSNLSDIDKRMGEYPNSMDEFGNVYLGIDSGMDQCIRQGARGICALAGLTNKFGAEAIFYILHTMSLMFLSGIDLNCEHMNELRKLAIMQTSMTVLIRDKVHHREGCYEHWKSGRTIAMHYSKPTKTHSSLFSIEFINKYKLNEPLWWALMMSMLDIFDEQIDNYKSALEILNIEPTREKYLEWFRENHPQEDYRVMSFEPIQTSVIAMAPFDFNNPNNRIYQLEDHNSCKTKTWYSQNEINNWVIPRGCVWCKFRPNQSNFTRINGNIWKEEYRQELASSQRNIKAPQSIVPSVFNASSKLIVKKSQFRIILVGTVGSGKTTFAERTQSQLERNGYSCLIVSADKWSLLGFSGRAIQENIFNELIEFNRDENPKKVIIMDLCNERPLHNKTFGFNFSEYTDIIHYPNLDKNRFNEYEKWALTNILKRSENTSYLNPIRTGFTKCLDIFNKKTNDISKLLNIPREIILETDQNRLLESIQDEYESYQRYVESIDPDSTIVELLTRHKVI